MGIFKGDSIYKGGGGGGSLKNAGTLTDADFIHVDNNTISDYTNDTRSDIYFYFDKKDYPLNAVISVNTDVNATVHVYIYDGFVFIPLGLIGSKSIVGGNDYNVIINGDAYYIDEVIINSEEEFIDISGEKIEVVKIGSLLWTKKDLQADFPYSQVGPIGKPEPQATYAGYFYMITKNCFNYINSLLKSGWRIPSASDFNNLQNSINNDFDKILKDGSNTTGFSMTLNGSYSFNTGISQQGVSCRHLASYTDSKYYSVSYTLNGNTFLYNDENYGTYYTRSENIRLCRDA